MKNSFVSLSREDKVFLIKQVSQKTTLPPRVVEKDWWMVQVLRAMAQTSCSDYLSFKGGTSLSKAWDLIERFSEDVNLALDRQFFNVEKTSRSQLLKLRKTSRNYITTQLAAELQRSMTALGCQHFEVVPVTERQTKEGAVAIDEDTDPTVLLVWYDSVIEDEVLSYLHTAVKIEISCLSMNAPVSMRPIRSIIAQQVAGIDADADFSMSTVTPSRTFLEKAFLLSEEFQKETPQWWRMSRHLYDMERIMDTQHGADALSDRDLYQAIVEHRRRFYALKHVDYNALGPESITFVPPQKWLHLWESDYATMCDSFIFGSKIPFAQLLSRMEELQQRFRTLRLS